MAKKVSIDFDLVTELAKKGYTATMVAKAVGCSRSYFFKHIKPTFELAKNKASKELIDTLFAHARLEGGFQATKYLCEKMHVYSENVPITKPKDATDAFNKMGDILVMVCKNELSTDKADKIFSYLEKIVKTHADVELEERLIALEENLEKKS